MAYFNPRTPVGCDTNKQLADKIVQTFQSTHPSGVRRHDHRPVGHADYISIHAPQWGATGLTAL